MPDLEAQHAEIEAELDTERENLEEEYANGGISEADYKKSLSKNQFQMAELKAKHEQQRAQEMGLDEKMERKRDLFGD